MQDHTLQAFIKRYREMSTTKLNNELRAQERASIKSRTDFTVKLLELIRHEIKQR